LATLLVGSQVLRVLSKRLIGSGPCEIVARWTRVPGRSRAAQCL